MGCSFSSPQVFFASAGGGGGGSLGDTVIGGNYNLPGNTADPNYVVGTGYGGGIGSIGDDGSVVIILEVPGVNVFDANTVEAGNFFGSGSGLTNLNASQLTAGTVADALLSTNVALLNGSQTFSGSPTFSGGSVLITNVPDHNSGLKLIGSSIAGTGLSLSNSSGGHQYALFSSGTANSIGGGGFAILDDTLSLWRFVISSNGNVGMDGALTPGFPLVVGSAHCTGTQWQGSSDRNIKHDIEPIDPRQILDKVAAMPITEWKYNAETNNSEHLGPMAQDFMAAFHLGADDKSIGTLDESGVALAAIQGLNEKLKEKDADVEALKASNEKLSSENELLKKRLDRLESLMEKKLESR